MQDFKPESFASTALAGEHSQVEKAAASASDSGSKDCADRDTHSDGFRLMKDRWNPYLVGLLIGGVSLLSFVLFHHAVGTTTTFVRFAAILWNIFDPAHLVEHTYYKTYLTSWINWQFAFVIGILFGAYIASKDRKHAYVPELWQKRFGKSKIKRAAGAFIGGVILLLGARLAGGCTSGHVIGGGMQLSVTGWLFMMAFFATGLPTAIFLYKRNAGEA